MWHCIAWWMFTDVSGHSACFCLPDGDSIFLWNVSKLLPCYSVSQPTKQYLVHSHHCENLRFSIIPFYFLPEPPHPHKPFTKPVSPAPPFFPPAAASILSSSDGNSTKLKARSKNRGLHGMGRISGGSLYTLGVRDTNVESSLYSPSRS